MDPLRADGSAVASILTTLPSRSCLGEFRSRAAGELPARSSGPPHSLGDLVERDRENVVQYERDPLPRAQPAQHLEQCVADLVVERHAVGRIERRCDGLLFGDECGLESHPCRPQLIQAQPPGNHHEPTPNVVDVGELRPGQPQKGFLRNVFGFIDIPEHLVGEVDQVWPVAPPGRGDALCRFCHGSTTDQPGEKLLDASYPPVVTFAAAAASSMA